MSAGSWDWARRLDDERPAGESRVAWIWRGVERQGWAAIVALLVGWGGVAGALFFAAIGGVVGGVAAVFGGALLGDGGPLASVFGGTPGWLRELMAAGGFVAGAAAGALSGLTLGLVGPSVAAGVSGGAGAVIGQFVTGLVLAGAIVGAVIVAERPMLQVIYGARRMSERERERILPLLDDLKERMGLENMPELMVLEKPDYGAYAHLRCVSVTRTYLAQLEDDELAGILAHELHHWRQADSVGSTLVWALAWPVVLAYMVLMFLARIPVWGFVAFVAAWPYWVCARIILVPVMGLAQRRHEYEADMAAVDTGYGEGLFRALEQMQDVEPGRNGWEKSVAATHPPIELRLEAIEKRQDELEAV